MRKQFNNAFDVECFTSTMTIIVKMFCYWWSWKSSVPCGKWVKLDQQPNIIQGVHQIEQNGKNKNLHPVISRFVSNKKGKRFLQTKEIW